MRATPSPRPQRAHVRSIVTLLAEAPALQLDMLRDRAYSFEVLTLDTGEPVFGSLRARDLGAAALEVQRRFQNPISVKLVPHERVVGRVG